MSLLSPTRILDLCGRPRLHSATTAHHHTVVHSVLVDNDLLYRMSHTTTDAPFAAQVHRMDDTHLLNGSHNYFLHVVIIRSRRYAYVQLTLNRSIDKALAHTSFRHTHTFRPSYSSPQRSVSPVSGCRPVPAYQKS